MFLKEIRCNAMKMQRPAQAAPPTASAAISQREAFLSSRSIFVLEIEDRARWTVRAAGQGATQLLLQSACRDFRGMSWADFLRCEDVAQLKSIWPQVQIVGSPHVSQSYVVHRICVRMSPPARPLAVVSPTGWDDWDGMDGPSAAVDVPCRYMPVMVRAIPLGTRADLDLGLAERILLVGDFGKPVRMRACRMCGMACCDRDYSHSSDPLEIPLRVARPVSWPHQFEAVIGSELKLQEDWASLVRRDFLWTTGSFARVWQMGYDRQQIAHLFANLPIAVQNSMREGCAAMRELISIKKSTMNKAVLLQDFEAWEGPGERHAIPASPDQVSTMRF